jgi:flagellar assembly protein FliH
MTKMTSSTDIPFSRVVFPALKSSRDVAADTLAYAQGHSAGYAAGRRKAAAEAEELRSRMEREHAAALSQVEVRTRLALATLAAAAGAMEAAVIPVITDAEDALAHSALELAETILGRELSSAPAGARAALARATATGPETGRRTVRMHPTDLASLDNATREAAAVTFTADETLQRGDAITEFEAGYLDARISTALARARQALTGDDA